MKKQNLKKSIEQIYQKKTQLEHILLRPETYVGSTENNLESLLVYCKNSNKIYRKKILMNWGLYKIFDEILVNAADNSQRKQRMSFIDVSVKKSTGEIIIENDGKAIPIKKHKEHKVYVPEMIFGMLLTGSNFDDSQKKTVGGRNGFGAKLANIFSQKFEVCVRNGKKMYQQTWKNNMSWKSKPEISKIEDDNKDQKSVGKSEKTGTTRDPGQTSFEVSLGGRKRKAYTLREESLESQASTRSVSNSKNSVKISFQPDLEKFGLRKISDDIVMLMHKRVIDIKAFVGQDIRVRFNRKEIKCRNFKEYVSLHLKDSQNPNDIKIFKKKGIFELGIGVSSEGFQQVSMVNGISTNRGGTHISLFQDQLKAEIKNFLKKKHKLENLTRNSICSNLYLFVNCLVPNPTFTSQTKESLNTSKTKMNFLSLPDSFFKDLFKFSPLISKIVNEVKIRKSLSFNKKMNSKGKGRKKLLGIVKLEDANWAGSNRSSECTLILTEGDSAKSLAMAGLDIVGRNQWGVFPLKGKFINVRNANSKQIMENSEIKNIIKIMGLEMGKDYSSKGSLESLRYGRLMIMADQDVDGTHIKGLVINFIHFYWPSLMKHKRFMSQFITPLIKVNFKANSNFNENDIQFRSSFYSKKDRQLIFYSLPDFQVWYEQFQNKEAIKGIKYYKGLGTSTDREARSYFSKIKSHVKYFAFEGAECSSAIEMAFDSNKVTNRKIWLSSTSLETSMDYANVQNLSYKDFVNKELIHFSAANLARSIPSVLDGLKTGKRKILFSCFKRKLRNEIKVAQLSGYVAEHSAYHHGEMSLNNTIINMAQNFLGSNNVNLLEPLGQFGSRYSSKEEAASPRYIYTKLAALTRFLFRSDDDPLLNYLEEEGHSIEPVCYMPVVPFVLVNGAEGIGSGWSTFIPKYDLLDLIQNIRRKLSGKKFLWIKPFYKHFLGNVVALESSEKLSESQAKVPPCLYGNDYQKFVCSGILKPVKNDPKALDVLELPVGTWTKKYKQFLSNLIEKENPTVKLKNFEEFHTRSTIHFRLFFHKKVNLSKEKSFWMKKLNLASSMSLSNLVLFDSEGKLKHYNNVLEILDDFFYKRLDFYEKRKEYLLQQILIQFKEIKTKINFIKLVLSPDFDIGKLNKEELIRVIRERRILANWKKCENEGVELREVLDKLSPENQGLEMTDEEIQEKLLNMKIFQLTGERQAALQKKLENTGLDLVRIFNSEPKNIWLKDLEELEEEYIQMVRTECTDLDRELEKKGSSRAGVYMKTFEMKLKTRMKREKEILNKRNDFNTQVSKTDSGKDENEKIVSPCKFSVLEENNKKSNVVRKEKKKINLKGPTQKTQKEEEKKKIDVENSQMPFMKTKVRKMVIISDSESD
jgi:DNA topoisomerase-2